MVEGGVGGCDLSVAGEGSVDRAAGSSILEAGRSRVLLSAARERAK